MNGISTLLGGVLIVFLLVAVVRILSAPLRLALKLLLNTVSGFVALWLVNLLSGVTGVYLGLNVVNALIVGVFGLPGLVLLILLKWVL
ncbi:MAG: pro-sigmaK processing inhibitor BofA family protein [Oscillospiraceae bacterium]|nr:pro-sigmaK processing inhibitor BofA family protein [Oscillospiraceae bacterium]